MSDETIDLLTKQLTPCRFPKRYLLIREGVYHKYAYFIEKGITRSYWLVDGKEVTTSFSCEGDIVCSRVNLGYIAAYLGITLPTLSKIRAEE